jgi:hypothetical protein
MFTMLSVWNIQNSVYGVTLFKGDGPNYWIIKTGAMTPIIVNGLFTVVSEEMLFFLERHVPDSISSHPIIIYDRPTNTHIKGFHRLYIKDTITIASVGQLDKSGMKIWAYENSLSGGIFISVALMGELKKSGISGLVYHRGFSEYGG